jgi:hypothetical protein
MELKERVADIKKYILVDEAAVAGIVQHLGIALQKRDSSLVAASDPDELKRVRESWVKKKLGVTDSDAKIDAAVKGVIDRIKKDRTKERVTVYYLLAEHYGKLKALHPKAKAKAKAEPKAAPKAAPKAKATAKADPKAKAKA